MKEKQSYPSLYVWRRSSVAVHFKWFQFWSRTRTQDSRVALLCIAPNPKKEMYKEYKLSAHNVQHTDTVWTCNHLCTIEPPLEWQYKNFTKAAWTLSENFLTFCFRRSIWKFLYYKAIQLHHHICVQFETGHIPTILTLSNFHSNVCNSQHIIKYCLSGTGWTRNIC
jgi:hypothetical protein